MPIIVTTSLKEYTGMPTVESGPSIEELTARILSIRDSL